MKGYKVFNPDWTCRGFQFEVGNIYTEDVAPRCCLRGFHFCRKIADCFSYYSFDPNNKVAEVEALGNIDINEDGSKCSTDKIHIIRELTWQEVLDMVNTGEGCTGLHNSGNRNSGDRNSGYFNSGDHNSGDFNGGNYNSGDCNIGNKNSGSCNSGHYNTGEKNSGNRNSGYCNSGNHNSGCYNSGHCNSGDYNRGNWNSGHKNGGNCNSGDNNRGNFNNGDWNKTDFSSGCFNTESSKIFLFNKPSDWTYQDWLNSDVHYILTDCPTNILEWVSEDAMTEEEKEKHSGHVITEGFLKNIEEEEREGRQAWWDNLTKENKHIIMSLPNFDKDIFEEITGIDVEE